MTPAWSDGAARRAAGGLALAASPIFAAMALLTALPGNMSVAMLCGGAHVSPLGGMTIMYALMSFLHAGPWLRLASVARGPFTPLKPLKRYPSEGVAVSVA